MGKILFYQWNAFMQRGIENALKALHIDYDTYYDIPKIGIKMLRFLIDLLRKLKKKIIRRYCQLIFTINFRYM